MGNGLSDVGGGNEMSELLSWDSEDSEEESNDDSDTDDDDDEEEEEESEDEDASDNDDEEEEEMKLGLGPDFTTDASPVSLSLPLVPPQEPPSALTKPPSGRRTGARARARASLDSKNTRAKISSTEGISQLGTLLSGQAKGPMIIATAAREREYQGFHLIAPDLYVRANDPCLLMNEIAVLAFIQVKPYYQHTLSIHLINSSCQFILSTQFVYPSWQFFRQYILYPHIHAPYKYTL